MCELSADSMRAVGSSGKLALGSIVTGACRSSFRVSTKMFPSEADSDTGTACTKLTSGTPSLS